MLRLRLALPLALLAACASPSSPVEDVPATGESPFEQGLLRDFTKDGKFDESGHPVNAIVVEAETFCSGRGGVVAGGYRSDGKAGVVCSGRLPKLPGGELILNVRLRPIGVDLSSKREVVTVEAKNPQPQSVTFTGRSFRKDGQWSYVPLFLDWTGEAVDLTIETHGHGAVEIDYIEVFENDFPLAFSPGSHVFGDDELITIEGPLEGGAPALLLDGQDLDLAGLVASGRATREATSYRSIYSVRVGELANGRSDDLDLFVKGAGSPEATARLHVYRSAPACEFVGDPAGAKVLITGFHPFPVAETHPNISSVAVFALEREKLSGAQVMRLSIPVEYDDAPDLVADAIARCAPDVVIDFGQGGGLISLEHTAYNLKDTGRFADNRGRYQAGVPIDEDGPAELASSLPLDAIKRALDGLLPSLSLATSVEHSTDPGRYICNDTFYGAVRASQGKPIKAGFIHLPYRTEFDDDVKAQWGQVMKTIVETAVKD